MSKKIWILLILVILGGIYGFSKNPSSLTNEEDAAAIGAAGGVKVATFTVLSPTQNSIWTRGTTQQISWKKEALTGTTSAMVSIKLTNSVTKRVTVIPTTPKNTTSASWKVPANFPVGKYFVTVSCIAAPRCNSGISETFSIVSSVPASISAKVDVANTPDSSIEVAGQNEIKIGSFSFVAQNSPFTAQDLKIKIPDGAQTSVSSVTIKYKDARGIEQSATQAPLNSTATFTGLSFYVPSTSSQSLSVYVSIPTILSGAVSGSAISVTLSKEGFKAVDASGKAVTTFGTTDISGITAGKGVIYVRKTLPRFTAIPLDSTTLMAGANQTIAQVRIGAIDAGDIGWKKIMFTINKTSSVRLGTTTMKLYDRTSNVEIPGTFSTTEFKNETQGTRVFTASTEQQIAAGTYVTYELRTSVSGVTSGSNLNVSIEASSRSTETGTAQFIELQGTTPSFIWTDRSASGLHSESTSDWTNDYLIRQLPLTVGTKSLFF